VCEKGTTHPVLRRVPCGAKLPSDADVSNAPAVTASVGNAGRNA
jgi:hypothetical protein